MLHTRILRGAPLLETFQREIKRVVGKLDTQWSSPVNLEVATVMIGSDDGAESYRTSLARTFGNLGVEHRPCNLPADATSADLQRLLERLNVDDGVSGILVFMPIPATFPPYLVETTISPLKDVDGRTPENQGRLRLGRAGLRPSCPAGGMALLDAYGVDIAGRHAVVIGRSPVVGGPLASMLTERDATVTICHSRTPNLARHTLQADLVALAVGQPGLLTAEMIAPGTTVLDFGANIVDGKLAGDADSSNIIGKAGALSPMPGGTGPVTAMMLGYNTAVSAWARLHGSLDAIDDLPRIAHRVGTTVR